MARMVRPFPSRGLASAVASLGIMAPPGAMGRAARPGEVGPRAEERIAASPHGVRPGRDSVFASTVGTAMKEIALPPSGSNRAMPGVVSSGGRMEIRQTERGQVIVGWVFALVGTAVAATGGYFWVTRYFQGEFIPLMVIGTLITLAGVLSINVRSVIVIDRNRRRVEKLGGFRRTHTRQTWSFDSVREVRVKEYVSRGSEGQSGLPWFGVTLELEKGQPEFLMRLKQPIPARRMAEQVARFMDKPLRNSINQGDSVRLPHQLDWPLARLLRESGETVPFPERPQQSVVDAILDKGTLTLRVPPPGLLRGGILWLVIIEPVIIGPLFVAAAFVGEVTNPAFLKLLAAVAAAPAAALTLWSLYRGSEQVALTISPDRVQARFRTLFGTRRYEFPADQIEELTWFHWPPSALGLVRSGGLSLYTDEHILSFGAWLNQPDQKFIYDAIRHVLSRG